MSITKALLGRIVNYAGLFPPAALDMDAAVGKYERYMQGDHAWMLGSFVVPAGRLTEFTSAFQRVCCTEQEAPWTLSVVCAGERDQRTVEDFQEGAVFIRSIETRAEDAASAEAALRDLPEARACYVEFAPARAKDVLPVLIAHGGRAKLRMGGSAAESVPSAESVAKFLVACARERVAWKATTGLHHAISGVRPLTGEAGSPRVAMHGFVNLFLAGAIAWFGAGEGAVMRTLEEQDPAAFQVYEDVIRWHGNEVVTEQVEQARRDFAIGFGSCSFEEPVADIEAFGWL